MDLGHWTWVIRSHDFKTRLFGEVFTYLQGKFPSPLQLMWDLLSSTNVRSHHPPSMRASDLAPSLGASDLAPSLGASDLAPSLGASDLADRLLGDLIPFVTAQTCL